MTNPIIDRIDQIKLRRPELLAFTAMCEARIDTWEQP